MGGISQPLGVLAGAMDPHAEPLDLEEPPLDEDGALVSLRSGNEV